MIRSVHTLGRLVIGVSCLVVVVCAQAPKGISVVEASISDLRRAMDEGRTTSRAITEQYLTRLARFNGLTNAALSINPRALDDAAARDDERRQRRARGPLHGIPVAIKDNIHVDGMPTTGGALAFRSLRPPYEATLVRRLRDAGAVIIAKTTMTELANWVAFSMPSGYNAILGFSLNPYDPRLAAAAVRPSETRTSPPAAGEVPAVQPGGSSSGIGTALSFWAASVGTETSGSILNPSVETLLVGIKPTVGAVSRHGVIPITADQDTPGPMARSVTDAAILLGSMQGALPDPADAATRRCAPPPDADYTRFLRADGLRGARIGIPRGLFDGGAAPLKLANTQRALMQEAIAELRAAGAVVVDPADLPSIVTTDRERSLLAFPMCTAPQLGPRTDACSIVMRYGMKRDFNSWLASLGDRAPVKSLSELRAWNTGHEGEGAVRFGQGQLDASDAIDLDRDRARYQRDLEKERRLAGREGIDAALDTHRLDALLFPAHYGASFAARAGYPSIVVPFPGREDGALVRFGVTFTGTACSEGRLLTLAYAFEQRTRRRVPPGLE